MSTQTIAAALTMKGTKSKSGRNKLFGVDGATGVTNAIVVR